MALPCFWERAFLTTGLSYFYSRPSLLAALMLCLSSLLPQGLLPQGSFGQTTAHYQSAGSDSNSASANEDLAREDLGKNWGTATSLIEQLKSVQEIPQAAGWASDTISILESLAKTPIGSAQEINSHLIQLQNQRNMIPQVQARVWNERQYNSSQYNSDYDYSAYQNSSQVERIGYRIDRRLAVWGPISQLKTTINFTDPWSTPASFSRISIGHLDPQWSEYCHLSDFRETFRSINPDPAAQKKVSRKVLARLHSPMLKPIQRQYLDSAIDPSTVEFLKEHASSSIDVEALLKQIERYESSPTAVSSLYLNDSYQNLFWSSDPAQNIIAQQLQNHYRNANVRFSVSGRLLNRLIPQLPATAEPISETIKGAQVSGNSHIHNNLRLSLQPSPNQLSLRLESVGNVQADTVARTNTFRVANHGRASFEVFQNLKIGPEGINALEAPYSVSSANQDLVGLESKLDNLPLLGWMARKLATNKIREDAPQTNHLFKEKVRVSAEQRIQQEVQQQVEKLRYYTYKNLFEPLIQMELEPQAVQMSTSTEQLMMRYRIAGPDQMAANSARPLDSGNSLISFQVHQTAINNAIARAGLNGNTFTLDELSTHLGSVLGLPSTPKVDQSEDSGKQYAKIGFAPLAPIEIEFVDDRFRVTLNLKTLKVGKKGKTWKNLSLVAAYKPNVSGMQFVLQQDDQETRIKGKKRIKFGDKAAISTVMKVLFKKQYVANSLPRQMMDRLGGDSITISQLVVANGWLSLSFDDRLNQPYHANFSDAVPEHAPQKPRTSFRRLFQRR